MEKITEKLAALPPEANYFSLEFFPPKTQAGTANLLPRLSRLAELKPLYVAVTWGAGGSTADKSLDLAEICQRQYGLTTCLHLTCTNSSRRKLDAALAEAKRIGIRNILALRGDEPREGEYSTSNGVHKAEDVSEEVEFKYAIDLVQYIRQHYDDYFCIGVAAYPEGYAATSYSSHSPDSDIPYLIEKVRAGADFLMTQLFYDVKAFHKFERVLRTHESGALRDIPIIPGLMPVQSWGILTRTTKLSSVNIPDDLKRRLESVKADDEAVKAVGVDIVSEIVMCMNKSRTSTRAFGVHFYTLNLEKAVVQILKRCNLMPADESGERRPGATIDEQDLGDAITVDRQPKTTFEPIRSVGTSATPSKVDQSIQATPERQRRSSSFTTDGAFNKIIISGPPSEKNELRESASMRANTLAISEGTGSLGREATWDEFPNGRFGDARSPAFGNIDGYGPTLHVSAREALILWSKPQTADDVTELFVSYLNGTLTKLPWSDEPLSAETSVIKNQLLKLARRNWWSVASQPAVDAVRSTDDVFGWGPRAHPGFVFQKAFVELFIPSRDWAKLKRRLEAYAEEITFFAGNARGEFESSDAESINPVTWGVFRGKEIITPTIIEAASFRAWVEEAFNVWEEWRWTYPLASPSAKLLHALSSDVTLVNLIGHDYRNADRFWNILLEAEEDVNVVLR